MLAIKPVGRNAAAQKYDILSALGVFALSGDKHRQKTVLRFTVLITTRYNWQTNQLSIGRAEIARLWSVDERTVKRELARLRSAGWLLVKRAGARGRVTLYEIDLRQILLDTRETWPLIGSDFLARMTDDPPEAAETNIVPLRPVVRQSAETGGTWGAVLAGLQSRDPELTSAWFQHLTEEGRAGDTVTLCAPTRFLADYVRTHFSARLLAAYTRVDPTVRVMQITASSL